MSAGGRTVTRRGTRGRSGSTARTTPRRARGPSRPNWSKPSATNRFGYNRHKSLYLIRYGPGFGRGFFAFWGLTHRARSCNTHGMARRNEGQIVVRLPNAMLDEIAHRAAEEDRSKSQIVRMAIASYLSEAA